jgi:hypothetical protein
MILTRQENTQGRHAGARDGVVMTKWILFHPVMPDPDPASRVVTLRKTTGFRVKPGMT